jgi:ubiquinone/menaquinone biosynthesis C-methylase UbiE
VIDLGSGTGRLAARLAPRARSTRAFDRSHHMLAAAREKFKSMPDATSRRGDHCRFLPPPARI